MDTLLTKGKILLSEPYLQDENFFRSVVLLCDFSNENGATGFVLNQVLIGTLADAIQDDNCPEIPLYDGGPVQMDSLFFIHSRNDLLKDSLKIKKGLYWGGDFKTAIGLLKTGAIKENEIKMFVGYSGWSSGQLEAEIKEGSWFVSDLDTDTLLNGDHESLWQKSIKNLNSKDKIWADAPLNPLLN